MTLIDWNLAEYSEPSLGPFVTLHVSLSLLTITLLPTETSLDRFPQQVGVIKAHKKTKQKNTILGASAVCGSQKHQISEIRLVGSKCRPLSDVGPRVIRQIQCKVWETGAGDS